MHKDSKEKVYLIVAYLVLIAALIGFFIQARVEYFPQFLEDEFQFRMLYRIVVSARFGWLFFLAVVLISFYEKKDNVKIFGIFLGLEFVVHLLGCILLLEWVDKLYAECVGKLVFYLLVYVTLPTIFAWVVGRICAGIRNNIASVLTAIGVIAIFNYDVINVLLTIPAINKNALLATKISKIFSLFNTIHADDIGVTVNINPYAPFAVSENQWHVIFMWILLAAALLLLQRKKLLVGSISALATVVLLVTISVPQNEYYVKVTQNFAESINIMDSWNREKLYYQSLKNNTVIVADDFSVLEYDIDIKTGKTTKVNVSMILDKNNLEAYVFTLHHDYRLEAVTDEVGNELEYEVMDDHITVYSNDKSLEAISMQYEGTGCIYMAGDEYTYFPEYYKYYPVAGVWEVFDLTTGNYVKSVIDDIAKFHVSVDADYKIYSNIEKTDDNEFQGESTGVLLLGGICVGETNAGSARIIYPMLEYSEEYIMECYSDLADGDLQGKDWFVSPYLASTFENHYNGRGYFTGSYQEVKWVMLEELK